MYAQRVVTPKSEGYEEKILRLCAERLVRRRMQLRHLPCDIKSVDKNVKRVMKAILDKHGNYQTVRLSAEGDWLEPIVASFVEQIRI